MQFGRRIYTYQDVDGVEYYSFTKLPSTISPPVRLILQDRLGTHIINFLVDLRRKAEALWRRSPNRGKVRGAPRGTMDVPGGQI